jgi:hypothetical protein
MKLVHMGHLVRMLVQGKGGPEWSAAMRLLVAIIDAVIGYLLRPTPPVAEAEEELYEHMSSW